MAQNLNVRKLKTTAAVATAVANAIVQKRAVGLGKETMPAVEWNYPRKKDGSALTRLGWTAVPNVVIAFRTVEGRLSYTVRAESKIRRELSLVTRLIGEQPAYLTIEFGAVDALDLSIREHLFSIVRDVLARPIEIIVEGALRRYAVAGSGDGLLKDGRAILLPVEHGKLLTTFFTQAHAALVYGNILAGDAIDAFTIDEGEYVVARTWQDLRAAGFDIPDWHRDEDELPDSQIWCREASDSGLQVRFASATAPVAGKGKTFAQVGLQFAERMRELGWRWIIPASAIKSSGKKLCGALHVVVKMRNSIGAMNGSYYLTTMLSRLTMNEADRAQFPDVASETWAEAVARSFGEALLKLALQMTNAIRPLDRKRAAQELLLKHNYRILTDDDDGQAVLDVKAHDRTTMMVASGWDPLHPALIDGVKDLQGRLLRGLCWGLGIQMTCSMVGCDMRLRPGQICVPQAPAGNGVYMRYPIRHAFGLQNVTNVQLDGAEANPAYGMAVAADVQTAVDGDFDGDRGGFSANAVLAAAVKSLHAISPRPIDVHRPNPWCVVGDRYTDGIEHLPRIGAQLLLGAGNAGGIGSATNTAVRAAYANRLDVQQVMAAMIQGSAESFKRNMFSSRNARQTIADWKTELTSNGPQFLDREWAPNGLKRTFVTAAETPEITADTAFYLHARYNRFRKLWLDVKPIPREDPYWDCLRSLAGAVPDAVLRYARTVVARFAERMGEAKSDDAKAAAVEALTAWADGVIDATGDDGGVIEPHRIHLAAALLAVTHPLRPHNQDSKGALAFLAFPEEVAALGRALWPKDTVGSHRMLRELNVPQTIVRRAHQPIRKLQIIADAFHLDRIQHFGYVHAGPALIDGRMRLCAFIGEDVVGKLSFRGHAGALEHVKITIHRAEMIGQATLAITEFSTSAC